MSREQDYEQEIGSMSRAERDAEYIECMMKSFNMTFDAAVQFVAKAGAIVMGDTPEERLRQMEEAVIIYRRRQKAKFN